MGQTVSQEPNPKPKQCGDGLQFQKGVICKVYPHGKAREVMDLSFSLKVESVEDNRTVCNVSVVKDRGSSLKFSNTTVQLDISRVDNGDECLIFKLEAFDGMYKIVPDKEGSIVCKITQCGPKNLVF